MSVGLLSQGDLYGELAGAGAAAAAAGGLWGDGAAPDDGALTAGTVEPAPSLPRTLWQETLTIASETAETWTRTLSLLVCRIVNRILHKPDEWPNQPANTAPTPRLARLARSLGNLGSTRRYFFAASATAGGN
jgi:hypothetical protein